MVNGKSYAWEDTSVMMDYGMALDIESIEYDDKMPVERVYGKGGVPRRYGRKNYEATCKVTVLVEEYDRHCMACAAKGVGIYDLPPHPIVVSYANEDEPLKTDRLPQVKLQGVKKGIKQNDEKIVVELDYQVLAPIEWHGVPATVRQQ